MHKHTTMTTGRASLCALGEYLRRHCFFAPLWEPASYPHLFICEGDGRIMQYMVVRSLRC